MRTSTWVLIGAGGLLAYGIWRARKAVQSPPDSLPPSGGGGGGPPPNGGPPTPSPLTVLPFGRDSFKRRTCQKGFESNLTCPQFTWKRSKAGVQYETKLPVEVRCFAAQIGPEGCIPASMPT